MKMPKMTCKEFDEGLREATKKHRGIENDAEIRPFVCDGSPLECSVFIVGFNPARAIPFWDYWNSKLCCLTIRKKWEKAYTARKPLSPTRRNINKFSGVLRKKEVQCLETNIYSYSSPTVKSLAPELQTTHTFEFLIEAINPTAILFHGKKARVLGELLKQQRGFSFGSQSCRHFSRGWSYVAVEKLADDFFTDMCVCKRS